MRGHAAPIRTGEAGWPHMLRAGLSHVLPSRVTVIIATLALSSVTFIFAAGSYLDKRASNATAAALIAGQDIAIDPARATPAVLLARLQFLLMRDRLDEAQGLLDQAAAHIGAEVRADALYNLANARLRLAFAAIEQRQLDRAIPLVSLAKDDYRIALGARPDHWDYKYNLDVAMRLVRDFPEIDRSGEEETEEGAKRVWTDLPGVPRGLP